MFSTRSKLFRGFIGLGSVAIISSVCAFGGLYFHYPTERFQEISSIYRTMAGETLSNFVRL